MDFINKTHPNYIGINIFTQNYEMVKYIIESITITCDCFIGGQVVKSIYLDILRWNTQNRLNIIIGEGESTNTTGTFRTSVFQFRPYHGTQLYNEIVKSTGIIHECEFNQSISKFEGRSQFNFDFGNYSKEKDEILSQYIIKTQELTKEEK